MLIASSNHITTKRFIKWLQKSGCEIFLVDEVKPKNIDNSKTHFYYYPTLLSRPKVWNRIYRWLGYFHLNYLWKKLKPDIVHLHWADWKSFHCYRARLKPLIITCLGDDINQHFNDNNNSGYYYKHKEPYYGAITGRALSYADHVFADSHQVIERCNILAKDKISSSIFYWGIDIKSFRPGYTKEAHEWRRSLDIPSNSRVIMSLRALQKNYRHDIILEAFASIRKSLNFPTYLIFKRYNVKDNIYEKKLRSLAEKLDVADYVRWLDEVPYEKMPLVYAMSDIIVNFPIEDAFPVSFFEAAACAKPVLSNNLPAYKEQPLKLFFNFTYKDSAKDLGEGMLKMLSKSTESASIMSKEARKWAKEVADEKKSIDALIKIYKKIER